MTAISEALSDERLAEMINLLTVQGDRMPARTAEHELVDALRELQQRRNTDAPESDLIRQLTIDADLHEAWEHWELGQEPVPGPMNYLGSAKLMRAAVQSLRSGNGGEVRVRALEWESRTNGGYIARANDVLEYVIEKGEKHYRLYIGRGYSHLGTFDTEAEAKAAAQADYDQRIRSALDIKP